MKMMTDTKLFRDLTIYLGCDLDSIKENYKNCPKEEKEQWHKLMEETNNLLDNVYIRWKTLEERKDKQ